MDFGNAVAKPKNFLALLAVRQKVASFVEQSKFVGENFQVIEQAKKDDKLSSQR